jgi:hypothetical protein
LPTRTFDWNALPQDGRFTILASTSRRRYGPHARATWRPDLHLALWNPYQALDFEAPALMTYGFAPPALEAVNAWLAARSRPRASARCRAFEATEPNCHAAAAVTHCNDAFAAAPPAAQLSGPLYHPFVGQCTLCQKRHLPRIF